ncbi:VWA domain-containing protein [Aestuariimicrobium sp. Y1814]|uniref:VWA domain-containing protein n=1 Tax=Aestuariimicrobium sp. Y1814 TaxID=3418742 RepID=UPI003DA73866
MLGLVLNPATAQAAAPQPPLPDRCGVDIALVLDASGSIGSGAFTTAKNSSKDFVSALEGTPSSVGIYTFSTTADPGNELAKTSVANTAGANTVRNHIDGLTYTNGLTNWVQGFSQVPKSQYDIIVFVTDGYPNTGGTGGDHLSPAIAQADAHKAAGTFIIGLGVGSGVNQVNLQAISGPVQNTDWYLIGNYEALTAALETIAYKACEGTVSVIKETQDHNGTVINQHANWAFNNSNGTPASGQTDANGALNFEVDIPDGANTASTTITEAQKPGWTMQQQSGSNAVCTNNKTGATVTTANVTNGFTVSVGRNDVVTCKVVNKLDPPSLTIAQTITPTFVRDYDWTLDKSLAPGEQATKTVPVGSSASFNYVVTATPTHTDSGWLINGTVTVTNPGAAAVAGSVSHGAPPGVNCSAPQNVNVAAFASVNLNFTCTAASNPGSGNIVSLVTWTGGSNSDTDPFNFAGVTPSTVGSQITVSDDLAGQTWTADAADGVFTKNYTLQHKSTALACQQFTNTATLKELQTQVPALTDTQTVTVCGTATGVGITNAANGSFERDWDWSLTKDVDQDSATIPVGSTADFEYTITATPTSVDSDFEIHGTATVTNSNTISLSGIDVVVTVPGGTCTVPSGSNLTIAAGASLLVSYTCSLPGATDGDTFTTTAVVTWEGDTDPTNPPNAADSDTSVDFTTVAPYETDPEVTVEDDLAGTTWTIQAADGVFTVTYTLAHEATELSCVPYTNTATITGIQLVPTGLGAASVPDPVSRTVTVCGTALDVSITNTVTGDFDRDHDWTLTKDVNTTNLLVTVGEEGVAKYTLTATPSTIDSDFRLTGTTVVTNDNAIDIDGVTVTVTLPEGTCVVVDGDGLTIPAGGSVTLDYTCTLTGVSAGDTVTTVATVVWEGDPDPATVESADESADVDFTTVTPTETDAEVVLTDDLGNLTQTLKATDGQTVITYDLVWTPTAPGCVDYPNVASLTDDGVAVTDTATVKVCAIKKPVKLPDTGNPIGLSSLAGGLVLGGLLILGSRLRRNQA